MRRRAIFLIASFVCSLGFAAGRGGAGAAGDFDNGRGSAASYAIRGSVLEGRVVFVRGSGGEDTAAGDGAFADAGKSAAADG